MLLSVNLGGVAKSIEQALLRRKTPFGRTPKVVGRTPAPALYVLGVYGFVALSTGALGGADLASARWWHAGFALATDLVALYGALRFVGLRAGSNDIAEAVRRGR